MWKSVNSPSWLKTYWKCTDAASYLGLYYAPANFAEQLSATLRSQIGGANVSLFAFASIADYSTYFDYPNTNDRTGNTANLPGGFVISKIFPPIHRQKI